MSDKEENASGSPKKGRDSARASVGDEEGEETEKNITSASSIKPSPPAVAAPATAAQLEDEASAIEERLRPDIVKFVRMPKSHVNHTYRNFSNVPLDGNYTFPTSIENMSFHERIYDLLSSSKAIHRETIQWCSHGRAFEIIDTAKLSRFGILKAYFGSNVVPQFRKQLHNHGYKQLTTNVGGMEAYYSEFLLRGLPHLLQYSPPLTDARTVLPDPTNEPQFVMISRLYPLPGEKQALVAEARQKLNAKGIHISEDVFQKVTDSWSRK